MADAVTPLGFVKPEVGSSTNTWGGKWNGNADLQDALLQRLVGTTTTLLAHLKSNLPFDPMKDFEPISVFAESPILLVVHPKLGVKTVRELIEGAG